MVYCPKIIGVEPRKVVVADAIAVLALAVQCALLCMTLNVCLGRMLPCGVALVVFIPFAAVVVTILHVIQPLRTAAVWGQWSVLSLVLGVAFFGVDWFVAVLNGEPNPLHYPGTVLGLPLTILICPIGTMVCVAGFARACYFKRAAILTPK